MGRMYSRKKGQSGSTKPVQKSKKIWISQKEKEIFLIIKKLQKQGNSSSKIGTILRDTYGIPSVKDVLGKKLVQILKEQEIAPKIPEDLSSLIKRAIQIRKHLEENHKDQTAKRGLILTESKIRRLVKYYKSEKVLSEEWKYNPKKAGMLIE